MSDSDSFIDEVNEEVRRDRLFRLLRKYGWIGIFAVIIVVGGAAFNEYRKATAIAKAQALGDEILAAVDEPDPQGRIEALSSVPANANVAGVVELLAASEQLAIGDTDSAVATLEQLAGDPEAEVIYSDLAAFKMILAGNDELAPETRAQVLDRLATPGAPFRPLALEQQVLSLIDAGDTDAAVAAARALLDEPELTPGLVQRVTQLMLALGADMAEEAG